MHRNGGTAEMPETRSGNARGALRGHVCRGHAVPHGAEIRRASGDGGWGEGGGRGAGRGIHCGLKAAPWNLSVFRESRRSRGRLKGPGCRFGHSVAQPVRLTALERKTNLRRLAHAQEKINRTKSRHFTRTGTSFTGIRRLAARACRRHKKCEGVPAERGAGDSICAAGRVMGVRQAARRREVGGKSTVEAHA